MKIQALSKINCLETMEDVSSRQQKEIINLKREHSMVINIPAKPKSKVVVNNNNTEQETVLKRRTRSETKILNIPVKEVKEEERTVNGYRLFDMVIFEDIIKSLGCPECKHTSSLYVKEEESNRKSCASCIVIKCIQCTYTMGKYTSQSIKNIEKKQGMRNFDVNVRTVYAMRNCGVGHTGLEKFCGLMNMPQPMTRKNMDVISNKVRDSAEKVAKASMLTAALDLKSGEEGMTDIGVTVDGTWQKRGFSSLNGVVAVIS